MRKKITKKKAPKVSRARRTTSVRLSSFQLPVITFRRIIIFSALVLLFGVVVVLPNRRHVTQAVAGVSIMHGMFDQTVIQLPQMEGVVSYNIYYKKTSDSEFSNAVRNIPPTYPSYLISYLQKGVTYQYRISAVGPKGNEFWFSDIQTVTNAQSM